MTVPVDENDDIEVTPEMIESGLLAFYETERRFNTDEEIISRIYREMETARRNIETKLLLI